MNEYEYIKILTPKEKKSYIKFFKNRTVQNLNKSQLAIQNNKEILLQAYIDYEDEIIKKYKDDLRKFKERVNLWKAKECSCGKKLRFIENYGFWGCPDYKSNRIKKHITFQANQSGIFENQYKNIKVRLSHNWSTDILRKCNISDKIKAKELLLFYKSEGFEDLREKYGYKNSLKSISSFITANRESKKEEKEIKNFLNSFFDKVSYQLYIKFKKLGEEEQIRIIDLIVSDNANVFVIEIKRHNIYIDRKQIKEYYSLIKNIMALSNDERDITSLFIVNEFYDSQFNENKCVLFDELKTKTTKQDILKVFNEMKYN